LLVATVPRTIRTSWPDLGKSLMTEIKPGSRWKSAVCDTEVVVVRSPSTPVALACGGAPMVAHNAPAPAGGTLDSRFAGGSLLGKRYADAASGIELLCVKTGAGSVTVDDWIVAAKEAKKLPASD
jgi:hypothetical protein